MLVQTVRNQFESYTKQVLERFKLHHELQAVFGYPSESEYNDMVINRLLPKCPIFTKYITNEKYAFGMDLLGVIGKTVRHNKIRVDIEEYLIIPSYLYKFRTFVKLMGGCYACDWNHITDRLNKKLKFVTIDHI